MEHFQKSDRDHFYRQQLIANFEAERLHFAVMQPDAMITGRHAIAKMDGTAAEQVAYCDRAIKALQSGDCVEKWNY
jgi:hypothetical protein